MNDRGTRMAAKRIILAAALAAAWLCADRRSTEAADAVGTPAVVSDDPTTAWRSLFDGRTLGEWSQTPFGGGGEVSVADGTIRIPAGADLSGVTWAGDVPRQRYEIELEARRVEGNDFFCGLTFPVGDECCSLILGGWGGSIVGLSSIDGRDAGDNETTDVMTFEKGRWYAVGVRVTPERIECRLDGEVIIEQDIENRRISVRNEVIPCKPLGIATYATTAEVRAIRWRPLAAAAP
jgi:hypothetical protein